jgi:hypothetical protein
MYAEDTINMSFPIQFSGTMDVDDADAYCMEMAMGVGIRDVGIGNDFMYMNMTGCTNDMEEMDMYMQMDDEEPMISDSMLEMQPFDLSGAPWSWVGLDDLQDEIYDLMGDLFQLLLEVIPGPTDPISSPTLAPSRTISPVPSPAPSAVPTHVPTTDDTITIATSMTMVGLDASAVTDDDIQAIRVGIAKIMNGIKKSMIKNVKVTAKSRRRHLLSDSAEVSFDVVVSLAETDFTDADDLLETVEDTLDEVQVDSSELITAIKENAVARSDNATSTTNTTDDGSSASIWDAVTGIEDISAIVITRSPTPVPTPAPSPEPTPAPSPEPAASPKSDDSDDGIGMGLGTASAEYALIGGLVGAVAFIVVGAYTVHKKSKAHASRSSYAKAVLGPGKGQKGMVEEVEMVEEVDKSSVDLEMGSRSYEMQENPYKPVAAKPAYQREEGHTDQITEDPSFFCVSMEEPEDT